MNRRGHFISKRLLIAAASGLAILAAGKAAEAQVQAEPRVAAPETNVDEVVVTARKRDESLIQVPDAITVFTGHQIENRRLTQVGDLLALTSNVNLVKDQDAGTNIISIRGIGANRNQAAAVAFVVDGVILPDSDAFTVDLSDAQQVEVLKGPQGALYGKGAIAGVINVTTKTPTNTPEADLRASYGSGDTVDVYGAVSGPIVQDRLRGLFSVKYKDSDGTIKNDFTGDPVDGDKFVKLTGRLIFDATDRLSLDLRGSYFDEKASASWYSMVDVLGPTNGRITSAMAATDPDFDGPHSTNRTIYDVALTSNYTTDFGVFSLITAYDKIDLSLREELDWTPAPIFPLVAQSRKVEGWSQEARFTSPGDRRLRYIVGAYYQHTDRSVDTNGALDLCLLLPTNCVPPLGAPTGIQIPLQLAQTTVKANQYAGFGQLNFDLTRTLELTAALRYDRDDRNQQDFLNLRDDQATFDAWQPKASLAWKPTRDLTAYATYSEGYKSGSFNPAPPPGATFPLVVQKESTKNFEIGLKTNLFDRRLVVNTAAFYTDYKNPQIFQFDAQTGGQVTINAKKARLEGFEADVIARPIDHLTLNASLGYTHSEILDFDGSGRFVGQMLPNMPKYTFNLGAEYALPVGDKYVFTGRVDFHELGKTSYQDFQNPNPDQFVYQPAYGTLDAQLALTTGDRWTLTVYGKNLTGTHYVTAAFSRWANALVAVPLGKDILFIAPGTTVGAELRLKFN